MRLVLDTNVLIAGFISHGVCSELLEHCVLCHKVVLSEFILDELTEKSTDKFRFTAREADAVLQLVKSRSELVSPSPLPSTICRDTDDDEVIAAAMAGRCASIITGDKDLLDLETVNNIRILQPSAFWEFEQTQA